MKSLINFIKGIFIGIAIIIPGLSGSIFAVVVGLYDKILYAINNFKKDLKRNVIFLTPVVIGLIVGIFASTKAILWVCENYTQQSYFFFIGLVLGSVPLVLRKMNKIKFNPKYLILTLLAFLIIVELSFIIKPGSEDAAQNYVAIQSIKSVGDVATVFGAGIFSVSLMAIPGVSGSIMLMIINQYGTVYNAVARFGDAMKYFVKGDFAAAGDAAQSLFILLAFLAGALIGLIAIAKLLGYLLKKFESFTYYAVLGLVSGAIFALFKDGVLPDFHVARSGGNIALLLVIDIVCIVVGVICTIFLDSPEKEKPVEN